MELEKYIKVVREAINTGYYDVQDALMDRDESLKRLKDKGWKDDETAYQQEYQKIIDTFNQEIADAQAKYEEKVQEEKEGYMKEVKEFYASDGSRIDLNFMNLIKAELPLTVEEITDAVIQNADNPTMIRLIHKYVLERNAHLPEHKRIKLENKYQAALLDGGICKMNNFSKQLESFEDEKSYKKFKKDFFSKENVQYMNYVDTLKKRYNTNYFDEKLLGKITDREYNHYIKLLNNTPIYKNSDYK